MAWAGPQVQAGPYTVSLTTQPAIVSLGASKIVLSIADASGKPIDGLDVRAIAAMPGMFMGEREQRANPVVGESGTYAVQAAFPMAGAYDVTVRISGDPGAATAVIPVQTGQNTAEESGGFSFVSLVPWLLGLAGLVFVVVRMRRAGEGVNVRGVFNRGAVTAVAVLALLTYGAIYAVNNWRRDGAMTPLEAQVMEMNTPPPLGTTAVRLASVERGPLKETVRYTGQAVGYVEQEVNPRVAGVIVWMPFYVGDAVKKGQVLARLDTSQLDPQLAERAAMTDMAAQGVGVAATEYATALQEVAEARAALGAKEGMVEEAEAMLEAARRERESMDAELAAMQTEVVTAEAEVGAAATNAKFRADELRRDQQLFAKGAISRSELQRSEADSADASARHQQAQSMVRQAKAKVDVARANVRKADSMIVAMQKKVLQAQADVRAAKASIRARESAAAGAKQGIAKERAGVAQARASYQSAAAQRGYSEIKAEVDGVVTQRLISPGVLISPGQAILRVAQIAPIRLQANVAMVDFERIQVGDPVTVRDRSGAGVPIETRVRSIAPSVDPQSRTGVVEVVWPNTDRRFFPGQFVEMQIEVGSVPDALSVPVDAVQHPPGEPGEAKPFVWLAEAGGDEGVFTVRRVAVQTGVGDGRRVEVVAELEAGQQVVMQGAAYLREGGEVTAPKQALDAKGPVVEITTRGYQPATLTVEQGKPVTITFVRRTEQTCGTEIVFPDLGINEPLPLNKPVAVTFTPKKTGDLQFTCGMDMLRGKVVVR